MAGLEARDRRERQRVDVVLAADVDELLGQLRRGRQGLARGRIAGTLQVPRRLGTIP